MGLDCFDSGTCSLNLPTFLWWGMGRGWADEQRTCLRPRQVLVPRRHVTGPFPYPRPPLTSGDSFVATPSLRRKSRLCTLCPSKTTCAVPVRHAAKPSASIGPIGAGQGRPGNKADPCPPRAPPSSLPEAPASPQPCPCKSSENVESAEDEGRGCEKVTRNIRHTHRHSLGSQP